MVDSCIKETHSQKQYFKSMCKVMYYLGMGNNWYEGNAKSNPFYLIWQIVANIFIFSVLVNEFLAYLRNDLNDEAKDDLFQSCMGQLTIVVKLLLLYWKRQRIMVVMERLVEGSRTIFYSVELEGAVTKLAFKNLRIFIVAAVVAKLAGLMGGYKAHVKTGVPVSTIIVFYPTPSHTGVLDYILRVLIEYHWFHIVAIMITLDNLILCSLLSVKCKFQVLQLYFETMRIKFEHNLGKKLRRQLEEDFKKDFLLGIKLHDDALWCVRNVQESMGAIYSIQIVESVALLVICLIRLVAAEHDLAILLYNFTFIVCIIMVTGFYMLTAGDITYEASILPTSIFHCGWELTRGGADVRVMTVVALQRSQAPVTMTAFGIVKLSYKNFIKLLRSSYSFFAVMY